MSDFASFAAETSTSAEYDAAERVNVSTGSVASPARENSARSQTDLECTPSSAQNHFDTLPDELLLEIFVYLGAPYSTTGMWEDTLVLLRVCQRFRRLAADPQLWRCSYLNNHDAEMVFSPDSAFRVPKLTPEVFCVSFHEALLLTHAAWPDPNSPAPPHLRIGLALRAGDGAVLYDHQWRLNFGLPRAQLGHVVVYLDVSGLYEEAFWTLWETVRGPAVAWAVIHDVFFPRPLSISQLPGLQVLQLDHCVLCEADDHALSLIFAPPETTNNLRILDVHGYELSSEPAAGANLSWDTILYSVSPLRYLKMPAGTCIPLIPRNFPFLEDARLRCYRPEDIHWRHELDLPPNLKHVAFLGATERIDLTWCVPFFTRHVLLRSLLVFSEDHTQTPFARLELPPETDAYTYRTIENYEGHGFKLEIRNRKGQSMAYRLVRP